MGFLDDIVDGSSEIESPASFMYWAGLTAISAVLRKNVYLDKFAYKLYPNIYCILVGKSGIRKSFPVNTARQLIQMVDNTRIITGRNSIQGIIKDLSLTHTGQNGGPPMTEAHCCIISGELSVLMVEDPSAHTVLTDLYDTHAHELGWTNRLKGTGTETLKSPYFVLLGASNPTLLEESLPPTAYTGGFIGRCMMVYEERRRVKNPLTDPPKKIIDLVALSKYLKQLTTLKGQFIWDAAAKKEFNKWYMAFDVENVQDKSGTAERMHEHILKVAMLIALAEAPILVLEKRHIIQARDICMLTTATTSRITSGQGKSDMAKKTHVLISELLARPKLRIKRSEFLQKYWGDVDSFDLEKILNTLTQAKAVFVSPLGNADSWIELSQAVADFYKGPQVVTTTVP